MWDRRPWMDLCRLSVSFPRFKNIPLFQRTRNLTRLKGSLWYFQNRGVIKNITTKWKPSAPYDLVISFIYVYLNTAWMISPHNLPKAGHKYPWNCFPTSSESTLCTHFRNNHYQNRRAIRWYLPTKMIILYTWLPLLSPLCLEAASGLFIFLLPASVSILVKVHE